jgi:broad specificity phosphatase PhoE
MPKLILIKHARPEIDPAIPAEEWILGPQGRESATRLADRLREYPFSQILSSSEPKALQTAQIVGHALDRPVEQVHDLYEHDRRDVPHMDSREFISLVALFFKQPDQLVLGNETADEAYDRFAAAVDGILQQHPGDIAIMTHGTVISLFAQRRAKQEPFALWRRMGQPSFIVFETPGWRVTEIVERV